MMSKLPKAPIFISCSILLGVVGLWNFATNIQKHWRWREVLWWGDAGYNLEDWLSDKHTPSRKSAIERREERRASEGEAEYQVFINSLLSVIYINLSGTQNHIWAKCVSGPREEGLVVKSIDLSNVLCYICPSFLVWAPHWYPKPLPSILKRRKIPEWWTGCKEKWQMLLFCPTCANILECEEVFSNIFFPVFKCILGRPSVHF